MYIATLLGAIERLRGERDNLRRDLNFLDIENQFAVQALETRVTSAVAHGNGAKIIRHEIMGREQDQYIKRLDLAVTASAIVAGHLQLQLDDISADATQLEGRLTAALQDCEAKDKACRDLRAKLDATDSLDVAQIQSSIRLPQSEPTVQTPPEDPQKIKAAHHEIKEALDRAAAHISDLTDTLEEVESQRDSLHLQVTNLQSDLAIAQEDLTEAEGRYSTLQAQQLSSMSSGEVAQSLREQIEELEMRVLRRTEQIGIHQHDIKRLETNLRLQEERVGEMTSELETLEEQKEAMVWDCADAREARDEAIQKCEGLELEVEALEGRLEKVEEVRDQEVIALVEVVMDLTVRSRAALRALGRPPADDNSAAHAQQATLALAVAQVELKSKLVSLEDSNKAKAVLQARVESLQEDLAKKTAVTKHLEEQFINLRERFGADAVSESRTMDQIHGDHTEQMKTLQQSLNSAINELQESTALRMDAEARHQEAMQETNQTKVELESRLTAALEHMQNDLEKGRADHIKEVNCLQEQMRGVEEQLQDAIRSRAELENLHQTVVTDLMRTKEDHEAHLSQATLQSLDALRQLEGDLANAKAKHAEDLDELEGRLKDSVEEVGRLQIRLQDELDRHDMEKQTHMAELESKAEECRRAESLEADLHQEIALTRTQLDQTRTALQAIEAEKSALQMETTNLGAAMQRTISLNRFMESEVKEW